MDSAAASSRLSMLSRTNVHRPAADVDVRGVRVSMRVAADM